MHNFIFDYPLWTIIILGSLSALCGVWAGYISGRAMYKALVTKMRPFIAGGVALVWYLFWSLCFFIFALFGIEALVIDLGARESDFWFLDFFGIIALIPFVLCVIIAGGLLVSRARAGVGLEHKPLSWLKVLWHCLRAPLGLLLGFFVVLVLLRIPAVNDQQNDTQTIAYIKAQHITMADVMGTNLPPQPYAPENDATVAGIDKNNNGIRDDVELAIFAKYPNSARVRAAELQYAMALQLMLTQVSDTDTWIAAANQYSRADDCISDSIKKKEVDNLVVNTDMRKQAEDSAFKFTTSVSIPSSNFCDIDLQTLPN